MTEIDLDSITLKSGRHRTHDAGMCLLEAVAWMAGEPHSDQPACVSPVLAAFGRAWNDGMGSDEERGQLKRYVPLLLNTVAGPVIEEQRAYMAVDWLVRVNLPTWLRLAELQEHAEALERLQPLTSSDGVLLARAALAAAGDAAGDAGDAARAAAGDAAGDAAWAAAWAARDAGVATWAAAWDAARAAARAAAGDAAWAAARAAAWAAGVAGVALAPTVLALQVSAHDLYRRMIECGQ